MKYEDLLIIADSSNLTVKEKNLVAHDGRIKNNRIAIRRNIRTEKEKSCVLAEELGHYFTSSGDIMDQNVVEHRKQERRARFFAYNLQIGLSGLVKAFESGCRSKYDIAEFLNVTEDFLNAAIDCYREKYGVYTKFDNYVIYFIPNLRILKITDSL